MNFHKIIGLGTSGITESSIANQVIEAAISSLDQLKWAGKTDYTSSSSTTDTKLRPKNKSGQPNDFIVYLNGDCTLPELIRKESAKSMTTDCLGAIFYWILKSGAIDEQKVKNFLCTLRSISCGYLVDKKSTRVSISEMKALSSLIRKKTLLTDISAQQSKILPGDIVLFHITVPNGKDHTNITHYALSTGGDKLIESGPPSSIMDLLLLGARLQKNPHNEQIVTECIHASRLPLEHLGLPQEISSTSSHFIRFLFGPEFNDLVIEKSGAHRSTIQQTLATLKKSNADSVTLKTTMIVLHNPLDAINAMDPNTALTPEVLTCIPR